MTARARARIPFDPLAPAIELVRATCAVCRAPRVLCGVVNGGPSAPPLCFSCAISMAQLIAAAEKASKRPHDRPCTCEACVVFDEGQRGEIANLTLVDGEHRPVAQWSIQDVTPAAPAAPSTVVAEVANDTLTDAWAKRVHGLEVDKEGGDS